MRAVCVASFIFCGLITTGHACTSGEAVAKMQTILSSPEYSAFISSAGQRSAPSKNRDATKGILRQFGGNAGRAVAGSMQDRDNEKALAEAQASVASVTAFTQTLNEAGTALGKGDGDKACAIYDRLMLGLGIEP